MAMSKETDGRLFAAVMYPITEMWGDTMDDLQRASLANQIVREIERRNIVVSFDDIASEREACARIASGHEANRDCDDRGSMDMETGEVPCSAERRGDVCVCAELNDQAGAIAKRIRARGDKRRLE